MKLVRLKHIDSLSYVLELNYRGINLNFINLAKLLIDGDLESNSGPTENSGKSLCGLPKKTKVFKGTPNKFDLSESSNVKLASCPKAQNLLQYNLTSQLKNH